MGAKGLVWSAASMGILLDEGIGDTVRVSLTPRPGGDRREEVYAACELLQSLGLRSFAPSVTACPGCGRTTSTTFQELAESIQGYIRDKMPEWKRALRRRRGIEAGGDGLHRQRSRRIEGREYRNQPAGNGRSAALPGLYRRTEIHYARRQLTTSCRLRFRRFSMTTLDEIPQARNAAAQPWFLQRPSSRPPPASRVVHRLAPRATPQFVPGDALRDSATLKTRHDILASTLANDQLLERHSCSAARCAMPTQTHDRTAEPRLATRLLEPDRHAVSDRLQRQRAEIPRHLHHRRR